MSSGGPRVAMVLAAGRGTRMRPLTEVLPKPALPVLGEPLVAWAMRQAERAGVSKIVVNTWHLAERMEAAVRSVSRGVPVAISREERLMDTAGGIALARERGLLGGDGPVLVLNGDGLYGLDLAPVLEVHGREDLDVTVALLPHLDPARWSRVLLDPSGRVTGIRPPGDPAPGEAPFLYPGAMVLARRVVDRLPVEPGGILERIWNPAMADGRMGGVVVAGHWREIGTPGAYLDAVLELLGEGSWIAGDAAVDPTASLGRSAVGTAVAIGPGAVVGESILDGAVTVGEGARVIRCVLVGPVTIGPGETVTGAVQVAAP